MMNDRFKFRAWNKKTLTMIDLEAITPLALNSSGLSGIFIPDNEDIIIEQCTGLSDKNGKLIFEGDRCKQYDWWSDINGDSVFKEKEGFIVFNKDAVCFDFVVFDHTDRYGDHYEEVHTKVNSFLKFEIIGNIHENREHKENE